MKLEFDSMEEVFAFVDKVRPRGYCPQGWGDYELAYELSRIHKDQSKIAAVKVFRYVTGQMLRESKDAIDRHWD
jgi:hypothetical protein